MIQLPNRHRIVPTGGGPEDWLRRVQARFPLDWLEGRGARSATDLDLAVLLVNTLDLLEEPPDRLTNVDWIMSALAQVGHESIAADLTPADLPRLRGLRRALRSAFEASNAARAAEIINPRLEAARAVFMLVVEEAGSREGPPERVRFDVGVASTGMEALEARLPAAVAMHIARHGVDRLGTCGSDPCRCAFVDRTRAGTRRYCCSWCNDRAAARAYRKRQRG
jgi:predicted RNA-binding Zn ribbon-like protein